MSGELRSFDFGVTPIRVVLGPDGQPLWVARDVVEAMGYAWKGVSGSLPHVPDEWRGVCSVQTPSGTQQMVVLQEQGLYFFLARSDKPAALPFQKWIAGEVLPAIRRTGRYEASTPTFDVPKTLSSALRLAADQADQIEHQRATIAVMEPKAAFADKVAVSVNGVSIGDFAKVIGTGQNRLFAWLRREGLLMPESRLPYQEFVERGWFQIIEQSWEDWKGGVHTSFKTLITGRGQIVIERRFSRTARLADGASC